MTTILRTNIDGLKGLKTNEVLNLEDYVHIKDKLHVDEPCLFKLKGVENIELDLKLVKVVSGLEVEEEEIEKYNTNQLVEVCVNGKDYVLFFETRVSKKQIIMVDDSFFEVVDIEKRKGLPNILKLEQLVVKETTSVFAVLKMGKELNKEIIHALCDSWEDASRTVVNMRGKSDGYFYRLGSFDYKKLKEFEERTAANK